MRFMGMALPLSLADPVEELSFPQLFIHLLAFLGVREFETPWSCHFSTRKHPETLRTSGPSLRFESGSFSQPIKTDVSKKPIPCLYQRNPYRVCIAVGGVERCQIRSNRLNWLESETKIPSS
jgi:hypothetical protein